MDREPLVSVVTPYYNTAPYLRECIEGVLAQTHRNFEYILLNNKSTDGSRELAEHYARRDSRIRCCDNDEFLGQLANFNRALSLIGPDAKYVKMALGDDVLFPECLARMVEVAEREPTVGIVSSYRLWGEDHIYSVGLGFRESRLPGREACRRIMVDQRPLTGSQNTVMYRADIVRARRPFFDPARHFADTDVAIEILLEHDLGFVHQILSFTRTQNDSLFDHARSYGPLPLHHYIAMELYGEKVLPPREFARARSRTRREYFRFLGQRSLHLPDRAFWDYHRAGLAALGQRLGWGDVLPWTVSEALRLVLNPQNTAERVVSKLRRRAREGQSA